VEPLQSGFGIAGESPNVLSIRPETNPAGFYEADATVEHIYTGSQQPSEGEVIPTIFDLNQVNGTQYSVVFEDTPARTYWHLLNNTSGDTVLAGQTVYNEDPEMYEVAEGIRIVVNSPEVYPTGYSQTEMATGSTTLEIDNFYGPCLAYWYGIPSHAFGYAKYRTAYELRFTGDSTMAPWMWSYWESGSFPPIAVPFEVWNMTTNQRVSLANDEWDYDGDWQPGDGLTIVDYPYDPDSDLIDLAFPYEFGWRFDFDSVTYNPSVGDVYTIEAALLSGPDDVFTFQLDGIDANLAQNELKDIKVVPNPYFVQYSSRVETVEGQSMLYFNNLPDECTIRIYNLAGDLVRTVEHNDDSGSETWDLLSESGRQVAAGLYLFHVESPYGEYLGRFAVVK
jgi:hypothetical protein